MKKENLKNEIKELLLNDLDVLRDVVSNLNIWSDYFKFLEVYNNDEEFFDMFFSDINPILLARAIYYGDFNYNDDYIKFDDNNNLITLSKYKYEGLLKTYVEEIIEYLIDNFEHIVIYNDKLEDLLFQYFEEEV